LGSLLWAWYDVPDIATLSQDEAGLEPVADDGDATGRTADKSGNDHHLTQATTGFKPLYKTAVQNGLSVLLFDGIDDYLRGEGWTDGTGFYVAAVIKVVTVVGDRYLWDSQAPVRLGFRQFQTLGNLQQQTGPQANTLFYDPTAFSLAEVNYHEAPASYNRRNASSVTSGGDVNESVVSGLILGGRGDITRFSNFYLGEFVLCTAEPSAEELASLQGYLLSKWGIA
jgi:hypothetical protein